MEFDDILAGLGLLLLVAATVAGCLLGSRSGITTVRPYPAACVFDGGGVLLSGDAARTSDGHVWACDDGRLYRTG